MAVYDRLYKGYDGQLAPPQTRFLVIARYALSDVFRSRFFLAFFVACFLIPISCASIIYLHYNVEALKILPPGMAEAIRETFKIDSGFFRDFYLRQQLLPAFVLIFIVGPALVSPDLRNNSMPLYLSRPITRTDYVIGKVLVLLLMTSAVTWAPGLLLFAMQAYLGGLDWLRDNIHVPFALVLGSLFWIVPLTMLSLAVSAWVKWKPWARVFFLGLIFIGFAVGNFLKFAVEVSAGSLLVVWDSIARILDFLFRVKTDVEMSVLAAVFAMVVLTLMSTFLLYQRIKAYEVVS
jgi:ABC-2 type transport system permease protein